MKPARPSATALALVAAFVAVAALAGSAVGQHGTPGTTQLISRPTGTAPASPGSVNSSQLHFSGRSVSADGRFVTFKSKADALSNADDNATSNVFVRDVQTGVTTLVSRATGANGAPAHKDSSDATISANGSRIAFSTDAALDPADTNGVSDVYVRDLTNSTTTLVSRGGPSGAVGNNASYWPAIDGDGKRIAFTSNATSFTADDTNGVSDVYARDLTTNTTSLISRATGIGGPVGDGSSSYPSISTSGTLIAFTSDAKNLDAADTNNSGDVYLRDLGPAVPTTALVSKGTSGLPTPFGAHGESISGDGTRVAFETAGTFDPADTNGRDDIYVRDLAGGITTLASRANGAAGAVGNWDSTSPSISADGSKVAFQSSATNLGAADANNAPDVYVRNLNGGTTALASRAGTVSGAIGNGFSTGPSISADGAKVAFTTWATNFGGSPGPDFSQVYLRNAISNTTVLVSRPSGASSYVDNSGFSGFPEDSVQRRVSGDGRFVTFESGDDSLSSADDNRFSNAFVRDTLRDTTSLVSAAPGGANGSSYDETISADGTTVAFDSGASNLVAGDSNSATDVFVRSLVTGGIQRIDAGKDGASNPALSGGGTKVAFVTSASLVPADTNNGLDDVYIDDLHTRTITLASRADGASGPVGNDESDYPSLSGDGTKVAFSSYATNFAGVTSEQLYVRNLRTNTTTLVSRANGAGPAADENPFLPVISEDGTTVAFGSGADNLVPGDTNKAFDVFVRNLVSSTTTMASRASGAAGPLANDSSGYPAISADGTKIAFDSDASNLVAGDTNKSGDVFVRNLRTNSTVLVSRAPNGGAADGYSGGPALSANGNCVAFLSNARNLTASASPGDFTRIFLTTLARECPVDPPETKITAAPPALTRSQTAAFGFGSNDPTAGFQCSLDGAAFAACAAHYRTPALHDGRHRLAVRAIDPAGYPDASPAAAAWTSDATAPQTSIASAPPALTKSRSAGFGFGSNDPTAHFQCSLDGAAFAACPAHYRTPALHDGKHRLGVRALDPAGNPDASPAAAAWRSDATRPRLTLKVPPQRLKAVRAKGLRIVLQWSESSTLRTQLLRGKGLIGTSTLKPAAAGKKTIWIKLSRKAKRSLAHTHGVRLKLRTSATDLAGNQSSASRAVRVRR